MIIYLLVIEQDLTAVNSLIVFFLTHGDSFNRLYVNDLSIEGSEFWKEFANCANLKNKPKMFIFQVR